MNSMMAKLTKREFRLKRMLAALLIGWVFSAMGPSAFAQGRTPKASKFKPTSATDTAAVVPAEGGVWIKEGPEGPAQTAYAPANGKPGPVIIAISGHSGPNSYQIYSAELAKLGYYTVLVDGNDILNPELSGPAHLKQAINRAQKSPNAIPGKVAVIGFSLGGGGALYNAANMPDAVSMVVAYYPYTRTWMNRIDELVHHFQVPILVLAGGTDRYKDCCVVETARALEASAKARKTPFELVVYPNANHGFNLETGANGEPMGAYRADDAHDAWLRTLEMLKRYEPLP